MNTFEIFAASEPTLRRRLAYLSEAEAVTQRLAPTDTGAVRMGMLREADAIRGELSRRYGGCA